MDPPKDYLALEEAQASMLIEALEVDQEICFIALGGSMRPMIPPRSRVTITAIDPTLLRWGEVALVTQSKSKTREPYSEAQSLQDDGSHTELAWVLHRVTFNDRDAQVIYTAGDRLPLHDPPRPYHQVLGVLSHVERRRGARAWPPPRSFRARLVGMLTLWSYRLFYSLRARYREVKQR